jgi:hypothetical protein
MATIQKTFVTSVESVLVSHEGIRAMVSVKDVADTSGSITARMTIAADKDGKIVQPATPNFAGKELDPQASAAAATLLKCFTELCDKITTTEPIFIRGSVPPMTSIPQQR